MKSLKFEKVNMKIVVAVGLAIIIILTAMFIVFKTNLIFDRDDNKDKETTENGGNGSPNGSEDPGTTDPNGGDTGNNEDPNNPNGEGGNGSEGGESGNTGDTGNGDEEPNYDDPDESVVSDSAKKRKKDKEDLTVVEKEYIFQENIKKIVGTGPNVKKECGGEYFCVMDVTECNEYTSSKDKITDCTGEIIFSYNEKTKGLDFKMDDVKCE